MLSPPGLNSCSSTSDAPEPAPSIISPKLACPQLFLRDILVAVTSLRLRCVRHAATDGAYTTLGRRVRQGCHRRQDPMLFRSRHHACRANTRRRGAALAFLARANGACLGHHPCRSLHNASRNRTRRWHSDARFAAGLRRGAGCFHHRSLGRRGAERASKRAGIDGRGAAGRVFAVSAASSGDGGAAAAHAHDAGEIGGGADGAARA
mmetsp:Transcript_10001/g.22732  ORF Transcript_10001/g.22732 Transcript_10001/m.22732 type:complete len:207 (+) Transcript_10001:375-995(+)